MRLCERIKVHHQKLLFWDVKKKVTQSPNVQTGGDLMEAPGGTVLHLEAAES